MPSTNGPGEFFANNPSAYALSLSGAGAAVGIFASRAMKSRGAQRFGWVLLCFLEAMIFLGMIVVAERAKRGSRPCSRECADR